MTKEDLKKDKYYRKEYGVSLAEYKTMLAAQKELCAICGKHQSEFQRSLHVDHDHKWTKVKITYVGRKGNWQATAKYFSDSFTVNGETKPEVSKLIKLYLKRRSIRGLLCWPCNRGLQKWHDNAVLMLSASQYLRKHYVR